MATIESKALEGNALGDPTTRRLGVYTPPSGETEGKPLLLLLSGFGGEGSHFAERAGFLSENEFGLLDRLVRSRQAPEVVAVAPDCLTSLGGGQYVNSSATGAYADFVVREVLPWAREKYRTGPVGVVGQSSGGFGALHLALEYPGTFDAVGTSAADAAFDLTMPLDFARALRGFRQHGGPERFLGRFFDDPTVVRGPFDPSGSALLVLALSACYSPVPDGSGAFELPFDPETGDLDPTVWSRWLSFDPCRRVTAPASQAALRRLRLLHLTASSSDEWCLDVAAHRLAVALRRGEVPVRHDEFPGGHFDKRPRNEALFRSLSAALSDTAPG